MSTPTPTQPDQPAVLSPVLHLFMILIPTVTNAFLLVYGLLGAVLEAEQKQRWVAEAVEVTLYTAGGVVAFCVLMHALMRFSGRPNRHPLVLANLAQIAVAAVLLLVIVLLAI